MRPRGTTAGDKPAVSAVPFTSIEMSPRSHVAPAAAAAVRALRRMTGDAGGEIRTERRRRAWSLATLAAKAGISPARLSGIVVTQSASLEAYARVMTALDLEPQLHGFDPRRRVGIARRDHDFVHATMGEVEARRLASFGLTVAIDEPYQHYQFAGRADVVAWDLDARALVHIENRTGFPNIQESLGSYASKRIYLGRVLAERLGIRDGWRTETHVIAALWSSEVIHVVRLRAATFRAACPDGLAPVRAWWVGEVPVATGATSSLVLLDPGAGVREAFRLRELTPATRPRYRGYADAAAALRDG